MKELLKGDEWDMFHSCSCSGGEESYRHDNKPGIKIKLKLRHMTFEIKNGFKVVSRGQEGQLASELIRLFE